MNTRLTLINEAEVQQSVHLTLGDRGLMGIVKIKKVVSYFPVEEVRRIQVAVDLFIGNL